MQLDNTNNKGVQQHLYALLARQGKPLKKKLGVSIMKWTSSEEMMLRRIRA